MTKEIKGKVLSFGKIKDYGHETNWGRDWIHNFKFFLKIDSESLGEVLAMVQCKAEDTKWGLRIPKDEERQRPLIGDKVRITTHRIRENGDGAKWASVTWNQDYEIIEENKEARKEREEWIQKKKEEREVKHKKDLEKQAQDRLDSKLERLGQDEAEKNDDRLPEETRELMNKTFNWDTICNLLRDTVWFVVPEGEGGVEGIYDMESGYKIKDGHPGTGLRRPNGALYGQPATVRKSILNKAIDSGLIIKTEKGYKATKKGIETLKKIDRCPKCKQLRKPVDCTSIIVYERSSKRFHVGIRYMCKCEIDGANVKGCNTGMIINKIKHNKVED